MNEYKRKLTNDQVVMLRSQAAHGVTQVELSRRFGVAGAQVSRIARGLLYADVGGPITEAKLPCSRWEGLDPMFWYARQGRPWAEAKHCLQMVRRRARA